MGYCVVTRESVERVLQQSLLAEVVQQALDCAGQPQLVARIVGERSGQQMNVVSVTQLIHEILCGYFKVDAACDGPWQVMCDQIAQSLLADPSATERLESLWARAGEQC